MIILGVLADTHVPDRARNLDPRVCEVFRESGVEAILHAGDVSIPRVLEELSRIAPVTAVRGNRDWFRLRELPKKCTLTFEGVQVGLAHGHGGLGTYLVDKIHYLTFGIQEERFVLRMFGVFPTARVIVFGHTHLRLNSWMGGKLIFNPGSACCRQADCMKPSVGLIRLHQGKAAGEIVEL